MTLSRKSAAARRPLTAGGRTTTYGGCATSSTWISTTLCGGTVLMTATTTSCCCSSRIPTSAFGAAGCRHYGLDTKEIIHYYSAECRVHHEFDLWTRSFHPAVEYTISKMNIGMQAQASMNIIYLECKLLDIAKCGYDFIMMSVFNRFLIDNI
jgi:hypothetical protein